MGLDLAESALYPQHRSTSIGNGHRDGNSATKECRQRNESMEVVCAGVPGSAASVEVSMQIGLAQTALIVGQQDPQPPVARLTLVRWR
jgi:hypothetical protein